MQPSKSGVQILHTTEETVALGHNIAELLEERDILLLYGELGAGKTTTAKAILQGLGVTNDITSPTFTLMNVYKLPAEIRGITTAVHVDAYRIENESELTDIGFQDYLQEPGTVCLIEWPEKIPELLREKITTSIHLAHTKHGRIITIEPHP